MFCATRGRRTSDRRNRVDGLHVFGRFQRFRHRFSRLIDRFFFLFPELVVRELAFARTGLCVFPVKDPLGGRQFGVQFFLDRLFTFGIFG